MLCMSSYDSLAHKLLSRRGITDPDERRAFLNPDYEIDTHNPLLLPGVFEAVERIVRAVRDNERIVLYSDYDTDGIPAAVMWNDLMRGLNYTNFSVYIPHRHNEGFGLNTGAVEEISHEGAELLITADCGIASIEETARARELGMDVIITDHHVPGDTLPRANVIVNPKLPNNTYPFQELCGAGVLFKVIQALILHKETPLLPGWEKWLLDMVGIATISDMVPLVGENRVFAHYGLLVLRKSPRPGLHALLRASKRDQRTLTEDDVGFLIGPRINAASRMGEAKDAFTLLATRNEAEAGMLAEHLEHINNERKGRVASIVKTALTRLDGKESLPVVVLGDPDWMPSLLGLVCNALVDIYDVPVFLWGRAGDGRLKGSCRAPQRFHLVDIMKRIPDGVFEEYGGHAGSGGFSLSDEGVYDLSDTLTQAISGTQTDVMSTTSIQEDAEISLSDVNEEFLTMLSQLAPFGVGNKRPVFRIRNIRPAQVRMFGRDNKHLKLVFDNPRRLSAIAFFKDTSSWSTVPEEKKEMDLFAHVEKSYYNGRSEIRLRIVDIH